MEEIVKEEKLFVQDGVKFKVVFSFTKGKNGKIRESEQQKKENEFQKLEAFRKASGLLTSEKIKSIRAFLGLNQKEFSLLLGLGEISIARYETKLVQSRTIDDLIRLVYEDPLFLYDKYQENKRNLSLDCRERVLHRIKELSASERFARYAKEREYRFLMLPYLEEISLTGDAPLSIEAIASLVSMGKDENGSITRNHLNKYLFYCDFLAFLTLGKSMTGLVYKKVDDGVEPRFLDEILSYPSFAKKWKVVFDKRGVSFLQERVTTKEKNSLSAEQKEIAKKIKTRLLSLSERDLSLYALAEKPLKKIKKGNLIDYSLSMRLSVAKW